MDKIYEQALLYDFYGELLTAHQKNVYEDVVINDFSLSEIAEEQGITRQGVHDLITRCNKLLYGYEDKLHLVAKFLDTKKAVNEINELTKQYISSKDEECVIKIQHLSNDILNNF